MVINDAIFAGFVDGADVTMAIVENALLVYAHPQREEILKAIKDELAYEIGARMDIPCDTTGLN